MDVEVKKTSKWRLTGPVYGYIMWILDPDHENLFLFDLVRLSLHLVQNRPLIKVRGQEGGLVSILLQTHSHQKSYQ